MTRYRHATFLTTQTNSSLTETVEHWSWALKMNEFNAWPVCKEHSFPKWFAGRLSRCWFRQTGFVSWSPQQCCRMWSDRYYSSLKATFPCSANCSRTVLAQTSFCCRLMSSCCSFALTPRLNTDRKKCLRSDSVLNLIPTNKQTKWILLLLSSRNTERERGREREREREYLQI